MGIAKCSACTSPQLSPTRRGKASFHDLKARGLTGVYLITSDAHEGIQHAISEVLPDASWQRCRTHFAKNLYEKVPKTQWPMVSAMFQTIFQQPDAQSTWAQAREVFDLLEPKFPQVASYLEESLDDVLAFTAAPKPVWSKVWSNNPTERLNREIRRRTDVVGIFPNRKSIIRLVGAVLAEQHDDWIQQNATCHYPHSNKLKNSCTAQETTMVTNTS